jgi:hypothetical protein
MGRTGADDCEAYPEAPDDSTEDHDDLPHASAAFLVQITKNIPHVQKAYNPISNVFKRGRERKKTHGGKEITNNIPIGIAHPPGRSFSLSANGRIHAMICEL